MVHWVHHVSWELFQDPPVSARGFLNLSPSRLYPADLSAFGKAAPEERWPPKEASLLHWYILQDSCNLGSGFRE